MSDLLTYPDVDAKLRRNSATWLVTGAAGFIGSHLCERLLSLGQKVIALDNLSTGSKTNITALEHLPNFKSSFEFIPEDIIHIEAYKSLLNKVDFVLHQAALGSVPRSIAEPEIFHHSNVTGFFQILNAVREAKVKKFVYASSSSIYGDNPSLPKQEEMTGKPLSPYAATKFINEIYASSFSVCYESPVIGLRYFNVFGKRQNPKGPYAAVIPLWIQSMLNDQDVFINGDGSYSRDFCYIENVVQANLLAALSNKSAEGKVYNVAVGQRTTLLQLFEMMASAVEKFTGSKVASPLFQESRKGDIPHSLASIENARSYLGYQPVVTVQDGISETVKVSLL